AHCPGIRLFAEWLGSPPAVLGRTGARHAAFGAKFRFRRSLRRHEWCPLSGRSRRARLRRFPPGSASAAYRKNHRKEETRTAYARLLPQDNILRTARHAPDSSLDPFSRSAEATLRSRRDRSMARAQQSRRDAPIVRLATAAKARTPGHL